MTEAERGLLEDLAHAVQMLLVATEPSEQWIHARVSISESLDRVLDEWTKPPA